MSRPVALDGIVLDLDDTLLDTHRQLVPIADRLGVQSLIEQGLALDETAALAVVHDARESGVWEVFDAVARAHGLPESAGEIAMNRFLRSAFEIESLELPEASEQALRDLEKLAPLALLTIGHEDVQRRKISLLGIADRFVDVCIPPWAPGSNGKEAALAELLSRRGWDPACVVVVGDRITGEIVAGNRLGCRTVWVRGGECAARTPRTPEEQPWRTVACVSEVAALLATCRG